MKLVKKGETGPSILKRKVGTGSEVLTSDVALQRLQEDDRRRKCTPKGRIPCKAAKGVRILTVEKTTQKETQEDKDRKAQERSTNSCAARTFYFPIHQTRR